MAVILIWRQLSILIYFWKPRKRKNLYVSLITEKVEIYLSSSVLSSLAEHTVMLWNGMGMHICNKFRE